jgi:hypothetical protein
MPFSADVNCCFYDTEIVLTFPMWPATLLHGSGSFKNLRVFLLVLIKNLRLP